MVKKERDGDLLRNVRMERCALKTRKVSEMWLIRGYLKLTIPDQLIESYSVIYRTIVCIRYLQPAAPQDNFRHGGIVGGLDE